MFRPSKKMCFFGVCGGLTAISGIYLFGFREFGYLITGKTASTVCRWDTVCISFGTDNIYKTIANIITLPFYFKNIQRSFVSSITLLISIILDRGIPKSVDVYQGDLLYDKLLLGLFDFGNTRFCALTDCSTIITISN